MTHAAVA